MEKQLKRQLLRQALKENLSTIEGQPAEGRHDVQSPLKSRSSRWLLAILGLLTPLLGGYALLRSMPEQVPSAAAEAVAPLPTQATSLSSAEDFTSNLFFPEPKPVDSRAFPVSIRRILLDPGHGGEDLGTTEGGLSEKDLTLDIASKLRPLLEKDGFEIFMTRESDRAIDLRERGHIADQVGADLFVSIHINWLATRQVRGIETYFLGPTDDPDLIAFARRENRNSGYRMAEMKPILEQLYTNYRQEQSHSLANRVQRALFTSLRRVNPELVNRGVKSAPFLVLISTEVPAILAEVSCLSNLEEVELLSRPLYREHIAEALARGIRGYAEDVQETEEKGT
jgi:N-acetylmuramoyl-L-alanine amidase